MDAGKSLDPEQNSGPATIPGEYTMSPVSTNAHERSDQPTDINTFKTERQPIADQIMSPTMVQALLQANNAIPADADDRILQPSDLMTAEIYEGMNPGDTTMGGMSQPDSMQGSSSEPTDRFGVGNEQMISFMPSDEGSSANNGMEQPGVLHSSEQMVSNSVQPNEWMSLVPGEPSREDIQMAGTEAGIDKPMSGYNGNETTAPESLLNPDPASSSSNPAGPNTEDAESILRENSKQVRRVTSADDTAILNEHQKDRLAKYRPSDKTWPPKNRSTSVPPRCVNHYSFVANWPPQEPPRCDFGHRVDVFPPKDAPLHLHMQAYALRWGVWTSEIKDKEIRRQVLDVIGDKMKEAWENAIGENYYVRPVAPQDDSDHRNETEEKTKRGRKRAVSPSKQPAGFVVEGRDPLAITNGELTEHNLTMDMINQRVQEKDFDAGEEVLDEVLTNLGRDRLIVKDWSKFGIHGTAHGRNLLMYSLFIVQECRNERRKLNNLLANFTKEMQKKNTRARIEMHQEREFQHLALAAELELARREDNLEESASEEGEDEEGEEVEMETDTADVVSQANDDDNNQQEIDAARQSVSQTVSIDEPIFNDHDLILQTAKAVLTAGSDTELYTVFAERRMDSNAFATQGGLRTGNDSSFQAAKLVLGEIFETITRVISHKEMVKREQDPQEVLRMNHDVRLCYQRLMQAQAKLAKALQLDSTNTSGPSAKSAPLSVKQNELAGVNHVSFAPQVSQETRMETHSQPEDIDAPDDQSDYEQVIGSSIGPEQSETSSVNDLNTINQHAFQSSPVTRVPSAPVPRNDAAVLQNASQIPQNVTSTGVHHPQVQNIIHPTPQVQHTQAVQQQVSSPSQATPPASTDDAVAKAAYIEEQWRFWLDGELKIRGKPPSQGVIADWPQIRDILAGMGFPASDRNQLLRAFKSQFEQYMAKRQAAQQPFPQTPVPVAPSPALSSVSLASVGRTASPSGVPPGWPSNAEIAASIPSTGIHANHLLQKFQHRVGRFVNQFSQLIQQVGFMDQSYMVYPSQQHAIMARQQPTASQTPMSNSPRPSPPASNPRQIVKLKLPQSKSLPGLPPPQDESTYPADFKSTEVNSTRGFSFRHLPHSTLEQRQSIDDLIADHVNKKSKARRKTYYGTYETFTDPQNPGGPPIAHGFWDFKDGSRPQGSEWFYEGGDVPRGWLGRLGVKGGDDDENEDDEENGDGQSEQDGQYREVWNDQQGRYVRFKLAGPVHGQTQGQSQGRSQQAYNTYPPGYGSGYNNAPGHYLADTQTPQQATKQPAKQTRGRSSYLDGNDDEGQDLTQSADTATGTGPRTRKRGAGTKRASSAISGGGSGGRGSRGGNGNGKRRKKNMLGDDEDDGDYVPGGE
ncbi:hypothetical protein ES702_00261 [subsurface metagenome]